MFDSIRHPLDRRSVLRSAVAASLGLSSSSWFAKIAKAAEREGSSQQSSAKRQCILLWMSGGPSQTDTFDMKPKHANGGEFAEAATSIPGMRFSEHLPKLQALAQHLAIVRSINTKEGDHARATYLMRTGQRPGSVIPYPTIGSALSKELGSIDAKLPNYVSVNPMIEINPDAFVPGFLGPKYAAALVKPASSTPNETSPSRFAELIVENLQRANGIDAVRMEQRQALWKSLQSNFLQDHPHSSVVAQNTVYDRAIRMMESKEVEAFDLSQETDEVRAAYGSGRFGQGCLVARRLIERGCPFVEVTLGDGLGWDSHQDNFSIVKRLSSELDAGWGTLMQDLLDRNLLETTTILWMGEFGRTPQINSMAGRDHFPNAWSCVFAGGGINGGQVYGKTSDDGTEVTDQIVSQSDVLATLCAAVGINPATENISDQGRPHKIVEGEPIDALLQG